MKQTLITFALLLATMTAGAQTYSARPEYRRAEVRTDTIFAHNHIYKAGEALRLSATYDLYSWCLGIASGVAFAGIGNADRKACNIAGTLLITGALACKIISVSKKYKAGTELMLSPGQITVKF